MSETDERIWDEFVRACGEIKDLRAQLAAVTAERATEESALLESLANCDRLVDRHSAIFRQMAALLGVEVGGGPRDSGVSSFDLPERLLMGLRQERQMADRLAAALDLWVKATEARRTETLPFSATPLSHPDLFNRHLTAAREANTAMAQALDAYRAMREGQREG